MAKKITGKILAALLSCVMLVSVFAVLPTGIVTAEQTEVPAAVEAAEAEAVTEETAAEEAEAETVTEETEAEEAEAETMTEETEAEEAEAETVTEETAAEEAEAETVTEETETEEAEVENVTEETEVEEAEAETVTEETETEEAEAETAAADPAGETPAPTVVAAEVTEEVKAEPAAEEIPDDDGDCLYINEYETALGISGQEEETVVYEYERDENGQLVLDAKGNPIAIVPEGAEIPVTFLRNENGELVLDAEGNPTVTQTVPADATIVYTIEDALNPDRTIDIYYSWNDGEPKLGGQVTFIAVLYGYDNVEYTVQWQESGDNENWFDVADATDCRYVETITRDNYRDFWRVQVIITGVRG